MSDKPNTPYPDDEFVPEKGKRLTYEPKPPPPKPPPKEK